jgi:hypothetical protein
MWLHCNSNSSSSSSFPLLPLAPSRSGANPTSFLLLILLYLSFLRAGIAHDGLSAIKGHTPLVRSLHYVDFNRIWIVPFCHAFYLGIFKDFLNAVFAKKSTGGGQVCLAWSYVTDFYSIASM